MSSPFPFPPCVSCPVVSSIPMCVCHHSHVLSCLPSVCVRQGTSTVCVLVGTHQHTALLCTILSRLLFLCLSSTTITLNFCTSLSQRNEWGEWQTPSTHLCLPNDVWKTGGRRKHASWLEATAPQSPPLSLHTVWLPRCLLLHSLNHTKSLCLAKREKKKEITTPGVPRLSPTLVQTRPEQA